MLWNNNKFQLKKPSPVAPKVNFNTFSIKDQLSSFWRDTSEIDWDVDNEINTAKVKEIGKEEFARDVSTIMEDNSLDFKQGSMETLKIYKAWGYTIKGMDVDKLLWIQPEQPAPVETPEVIPEEKSAFIEGAKSLAQTSGRLVAKGLKFWESIQEWAVSALPSIAGNVVGLTANVLEAIVPGQQFQDIGEQSFGDYLKSAWEEWTRATNDALAQTGLFKDQNEAWVALWNFAADITTGTKLFSTLSKANKFKTAEFISRIPGGASTLQLMKTTWANFWAKYPILAWKVAPVLANSAKMWAKETTKYWIVAEWELDPANIATGAAIGTAFPIAWQAIKFTKNTVGKTSDFVIKTIWEKLWGLSAKSQAMISSDIKKAEKIVRWEFTMDDLTKELSKNIKNSDNFLADMKKVKEANIDYLKSLSDDGIKAEKWLIEKLSTQLDDINRETWTVGQKFQDIYTGNKVTTKKELLAMVDTFGTKAGTTGTQQAWAIARIKAEINSFKGIITDKKLRDIEVNVRSLVDFQKKWDKWNDVLKRFSSELNDLAKDKIPGLKGLSEEYAVISKELKDMSKLISNKDGSIKDNLYWVVENLLKRQNKQKLDKFKTVFWDWIESEAIKIKQGIEAERAIKKIQWNQWVKNFINKMKSGSYTKDEEKILSWYRKDLEKLQWGETQKNLYDRLFTTFDDGAVSVNLEEITEDVVKRVGKINPDLGFKLDLLRELWAKTTGVAQGSAKTALTWGWLTWNMTTWVALSIVTSNKKLLSNMFLQYEKAKQWASSALSSSRGTRETMADFIEKLVIYNSYSTE